MLIFENMGQVLFRINLILIKAIVFKVLYALWTSHIHTINDKATKKLNILIECYKFTRKALVKIYIAFIRPVLKYSDVMWDKCSEKGAKLLEDISN